MKTNTTSNKEQQTGTSPEKHLSFYEENYLLEPEDHQKDNEYFNYESDENLELVYAEYSYQLAV